ncbi:serine hydrolase [Saccharopolyspora gloriosae]|uniref:serine hydrolase domain-containing protein n=1 Tax=Saccharopolyspora gloriosae TaxID=455344 RepID=UPI001FB6AE36|nr:serine hydrolase domain-containing protein [Saccharopolyspora gloriosae]
MSPLQIETDPVQAGFDPERLQRIDRHFASYVTDGKLPGWQVLIARRGRIAHLSSHGHRDVATAAPIENDTIFRIYSMTKPITSVAAMMLYEEGAFELTDPVSTLIPSFADQRVYTGGPAKAPQTRPATEPVRIWHLLTHTAGLTYGFNRIHPVDELYRRTGYDYGTPDQDLAAVCDDYASMPLLFEPGSSWNYGVSTDVLGRVVEVASGMGLDEFFRTRIFEPLGMTDTGFGVAPQDKDRLASLYLADAAGNATVPRNSPPDGAPRALSGGGGLVSTAYDYHRFTGMLLGGGALDGVRLLSDRTLRYMGRNHLPGGAHLDQIANGSFSEVSNAGKGFGLGFAVVEDPVASHVVSTPGELSWGGMASTVFWVDPAEDLSVQFFTQLIPSGTHPIRSQLHQLVYQALVD